MISKQLRLGLGFLLFVGACSKKPPVQHRLSADQLAWQGYQLGDILRFGHSQNSQVRTYRVADVQDVMEAQYTGYLAVERPQYQQIAVQVQRTDSVSLPETALEIGVNFDPVSSEPALRCAAGWVGFYPAAPIPLRQITNGQLLDTVAYPGVKVLPSATFGTGTYAQVIQVATLRSGAPNPGQRLTRRIYYAKGKGVVAFEENRTGLWYRLP